MSQSNRSYEMRLVILETTVPQMAEDITWIKNNMMAVLEQRAENTVDRKSRLAYKSWFAGILGAVVVLIIDKLIPWFGRNLK